jgi:carboxyl-terminal processing protease
MNKKYIAPFIIFLVLSFSFGYLLASYNSQSANGQSLNFINEKSDEFNSDLYWELWNKLKNEHVDRNKIDEKALFYGSLKGMAASLDDPYTTFLDPVEFKDFLDDLSGSFEGIGAEIGIRDDMVTVIAPLKGMPAEQAGLRSGDKIYAIDGQSTIGMTINEAVHKIRGPKDTEVILTIIREDEIKPFDITITRGTIIIESVAWQELENNLFLIEIFNFHEDTLSLFNQAVSEALNKEAKGIILDLRNNPGGYLNTAVEVASEWIAEGPVLIEQMSEGKRKEYFAQGIARFKNIPTVVLVNNGSASGSEIVAGALRDYKQATILGEQTFGKGSVQSLRELQDGSSLKITIAKWLTPEGDFIDEKGIEPDIIIEMTRDDFINDLDPQMDKAIEILINQ